MEEDLKKIHERLGIEPPEPPEKTEKEVVPSSEEQERRHSKRYPKSYSDVEKLTEGVLQKINRYLLSKAE